MNHNFIQPLVVFIGAMPLIKNEYFELGFAVLMISMLVWFGRRSIKRDTEREEWLKEQLKQKDETITKLTEKLIENNTKLTELLERGK